MVAASAEAVSRSNPLRADRAVNCKHGLLSRSNWNYQDSRQFEVVGPKKLRSRCEHHGKTSASLSLMLFGEFLNSTPAISDMAD